MKLDEIARRLEAKKKQAKKTELPAVAVDDLMGQIRNLVSDAMAAQRAELQPVKPPLPNRIEQIARRMERSYRGVPPAAASSVPAPAPTSVPGPALGLPGPVSIEVQHRDAFGRIAVVEIVDGRKRFTGTVTARDELYRVARVTFEAA